jgi:hypothetical protein
MPAFFRMILAGSAVRLPLGAALLSLSLTTLPAGAQAASEDAWTDLRREVQSACLEAAAPLIANPRARVDPFGSERFGLALLQGQAPGGDSEIAAICVFDKVTRRVEIGGELPAMSDDAVAAAEYGPLSWPKLFAPCGADCRDVFDKLAPADADALRALPGRVSRTVEAVTAGGNAAAKWPALAWDALTIVQDLEPGMAIAVDPGERACTVIWFGFLDNGGEVVGEHRCRIDEDDGQFVVTKLTGERRTVRLFELDGGAAVAVGRTYLPEQAERAYNPASPGNRGNANFGNFVGLAFASERGGIALVSADMRGHLDPDDTFFEVLLVE